MARKAVHRKRRKVWLEPRTHNPLLSKFIRCLMWNGKLSVAERITIDALNELEQKTQRPGIEIFLESLDNVRPAVKVKARRVGGSTYQIPVEVPEELGWSFAIRWILDSARKKSGTPMHQRLAQELFEAFEKRGDAFRKKEETHKMAEANRAFAHYRV